MRIGTFQPQVSTGSHLFAEIRWHINSEAIIFFDHGVLSIPPFETIHLTVALTSESQWRTTVHRHRETRNPASVWNPPLVEAQPVEVYGLPVDNAKPQVFRWSRLPKTRLLSFRITSSLLLTSMYCQIHGSRSSPRMAKGSRYEDYTVSKTICLLEDVEGMDNWEEENVAMKSKTVMAMTSTLIVKLFDATLLIVLMHMVLVRQCYCLDQQTWFDLILL